MNSIVIIPYHVGTDFSQILLTAGSVLAGMFPPTADEMFHPDIKWYSIVLPKYL